MVVGEMNFAPTTMVEAFEDDGLHGLIVGLSTKFVNL
jgi:hypothetical protein